MTTQMNKQTRKTKPKPKDAGGETGKGERGGEGDREVAINFCDTYVSYYSNYYGIWYLVHRQYTRINQMPAAKYVTLLAASREVDTTNK